MNKNARTLAVQVECINYAFHQGELQPVERIFRDKRQKGPHSGALKAAGSFMIAVFMLFVCVLLKSCFIFQSQRHQVNINYIFVGVQRYTCDDNVRHKLFPFTLQEAEHNLGHLSKVVCSLLFLSLIMFFFPSLL